MEPQENQISATPNMKNTGGLWAWAPLLLFAVGSLAVMGTQRGVGYAWDEAYYYEPARDAARWTRLLFEGEDVINRTQIDLYWKPLSEHPSFQKLLSGFSLMAFGDGPLGPILALRLPIALLFGLSLALIYELGRMAWGRPQGLVAALAYLTMPRVFGHAHFASMETPLIFSMLLTMVCFIRGLNSRAWAVACGLSLGLLLATKINGFFLIPPLIVWGQIYANPRYVNNVFAMLMIAPLVFIALWPWLWPDPVYRTLGYLMFHATHQQTALWFMGRKWGYGDEAAPWFYPSVMIGVTLPLAVLVLAALGMIWTVARMRRRCLPMLYLMVALTMWALASAPGVPKYDGTRLFLSVFPMLALMAGGGLAMLLRLTQFGGEETPGEKRKSRWPALLTACIALLILFEGGAALLRYDAIWLSYFNPIAGGLKGAEEKGFEVTYWGEVVNDEVIETLNKELGPGKSLGVLALHEKCLLDLQKWGILDPGIRIGGPPPYDAHLLLMRKGFFGVRERALAESGLYGRVGFYRIGFWERMGVPLLGLYATGAEFEQFWPMWRERDRPSSGNPPEPKPSAAPDPS